MIPYVISLGVLCEVRGMIKVWSEHLANQGIDDADLVNLKGNNFFDWNITNVWSVVSSLNNDFFNVFLEENLIAKDETDGNLNYVDDVFSGIRFHHTFSRVNGITDQATIHREYDAAAQKIGYLIEKFRKLSRHNGHIYFIRRGQESPAETRALLDALRRFRDGRPFTLVHVTFSEPEKDEIGYGPEYINYILPNGPWDLSRWMPVFDIIRAHTRADRQSSL